MKKIIAIISARTKEFYRDKASLGWNFIFPFFIIFAFSFIFSKDKKDLFQVAIIGPVKNVSTHEFFKLKNLALHEMSQKQALEKTRKHKIDLSIDVTDPTHLEYWVNSTSKNGYILEKLLINMTSTPVTQRVIKEREISYLDWVFPGILAMNLMFNCLWGVGYIIVKYRQNGFLKRLKATPLKAYQYLLGQVFSRYIVAFGVTIIVFLGSKLMIDFSMKGSYFDLVVVYTVGITCLISFGLIVSARTTSKEFADGVLNIISWPMMMLSGVWFSLEGAHPGIILFSKAIPLTHLVDATRAIMIEGKTLVDVWPSVAIMLVSSAILITLTSILFKWSDD